VRVFGTFTHFTSWLGLAPNKQGLRRQDALVTNTPVRPTPRLAPFIRRLSSRIGKLKAVTATARKVAVLFYNAVHHGMEYVDPGSSSYETRYRTRVVNNLLRRGQGIQVYSPVLEA
jgi:transposase